MRIVQSHDSGLRNKGKVINLTEKVKTESSKMKDEPGHRVTF